MQQLTAINITRRKLNKAECTASFFATSSYSWLGDNELRECQTCPAVNIISPFPLLPSSLPSVRLNGRLDGQAGITTSEKDGAGWPTEQAFA